MLLNSKSFYIPKLSKRKDYPKLKLEHIANLKESLKMLKPSNSMFGLQVLEFEVFNILTS